LFQLLKDRQNYAAFYSKHEQLLKAKSFGYETCFCNWLESYDYYCAKKKKSENPFKEWFKYVEGIIDREILFEFWYSLNKKSANDFLMSFRVAYNKLAERLSLDPLPLTVIGEL
jgi:hypothetical protein